MKRLIQTLKNIWSIEDLRKRILYTIGLVLVYRIGCYIALPGVDPTQLQNLQNQGADGLMGLLNMFSGGAFSNASIFALGIMPYSIRYHALHYGFDCHPAVCYGHSLFPEDAA